MNDIEIEMKTVTTEYAGTEKFTEKAIRDVFKDKILKINKHKKEQLEGQENFLKDKDWYVYNANYGTPEERGFVEMFAMRFEQWNKHLENIYLIRNEREVKIYDPQGRAFEPDFILFAKQKAGQNHILQVFIEPKGSGYIPLDEWKEVFLKKLRKEKQTITLNSDKYQITAVPFYNNLSANKTRTDLDEILEG